MNNRIRTRAGMLLALVSLLAPIVPAQTAGRLVGTVVDSQGAVVPKAEVIAKHDQTQTAFKATANDEGTWSIPSVQNGTYTITVTAPGFKLTVTKNVKVDTAAVG